MLAAAPLTRVWPNSLRLIMRCSLRLLGTIHRNRCHREAGQALDGSAWGFVGVADDFKGPGF